MIPSKRLLYLVSISLTPAIIEIVLSILFSKSQVWPRYVYWSWSGLVGILVLLTLSDIRRRKSRPTFEIERKAPKLIPLGKWIDVHLRIDHEFQQETKISLFDHYPVEGEIEGLPLKVTLKPGHRSVASYRFRSSLRGELTFKKTQVLLPTPMGLMQQTIYKGTPFSCRVYPDFSSIRRYMQLALNRQTNQLGIKLLQRRGDGMEFHQLRAYQQGDSPKRIDWKASSRRQKLIAKEFQDERDQKVIFMLDSGRNMRSKDGELSHFDHALNSVLLLSHIALNQGDAVGLMSFGGHKDRWLPPVKSKGGINLVLESVFDLQPSLKASDYLKAAEYLITRHPKRSLIILITNLRDETSSELSIAFQLMVKHHLVLFVNLREEILDTILDKPIDSFDSALDYVGTLEYLQQRKKGQERLSRNGITALDVTARQLPVAMINNYFSLKRSSKL